MEDETGLITASAAGAAGLAVMGGGVAAVAVGAASCAGVLGTVVAAAARVEGSAGEEASVARAVRAGVSLGSFGAGGVDLLGLGESSNDSNPSSSSKYATAVFLTGSSSGPISSTSGYPSSELGGEIVVNDSNET